MLTGMRRRPSGHSDKAKFPLWYNVAKEGDLSENPLKMPRRSEPSQADDEGSIPFTRSNLFNYLSAEDGALTRLG